MTNDKDHRVAEVLQLVTFVDTDDAIIDTRRISMSASHRALLDTGTWVVPINNRGWCHLGPKTLWAETTTDEILTTARAVVGPLTPLDGVLHPDLEYEHWAHLARILHAHGATTDPKDLPHLPHHVVLSDRLQKRFGSTEHDPLFRTVPGNHHFRVIPTPKLLEFPQRASTADRRPAARTPAP